MTKFDELIDIITHNRNKDEKSTLASKANEHEDIELQVSGSESTRATFVAAASYDLDPDIIDMFYTKARHKPNDGFGASAWDAYY